MSSLTLQQPQSVSEINLAQHTIQHAREREIYQLTRSGGFDLAIAGGGIHGAYLAWLAQKNGLRVALLELGSYGQDTSSRNSELLHGGLRYLRTGDWRQVFEGVNARELWLQQAPHLTRALDFCIPVYQGEVLKQLSLQLALSAYDLLASRSKLQWHHWESADELPNRDFLANPQSLKGGLVYRDGQMKSGSLTRETILAARIAGASCLNHASVLEIAPPAGDSEMALTWRDMLSGEQHQTRCRSFVNCAGPRVLSLLQPQEGATYSARIAYSQGSHFIFDHPWQGPALTLPMGSIYSGRAYFVLPSSYNGRPATLVGTTERALQRAASDYFPDASEANEIFERLARDLPLAPLTRANLIGAYAGARCMYNPEAERTSSTANVPRSHHWHASPEQHMLSLFGGKWTSAPLTALDGLQRIWKTLERPGAPDPAATEHYPGAQNLETHVRDFQERCQAAGISPICSAGTRARLGGLVRYIGPELHELPGEVLREEVLFALHSCQASTLADFASWFELEKFPSKGDYATRLQSIADVLRHFRDQQQLAQETRLFAERQQTLL